MARPLSIAVVLHIMVFGAAVGAELPAPAPPAGVAAPADPAMTGTTRPAPPRTGPPATGARPAAPPSTRPVRQRRPYGFCRMRARERGLRGADRRSFIVRCQLGYGPRRRGPAPQ
jgi:hypothetical protein